MSVVNVYVDGVCLLRATKNHVDRVYLLLTSMLWGVSVVNIYVDGVCLLRATKNHVDGVCLLLKAM